MIIFIHEFSVKSLFPQKMFFYVSKNFMKYMNRLTEKWIHFLSFLSRKEKNEIQFQIDFCHQFF